MKKSCSLINKTFITHSRIICEHNTVLYIFLLKTIHINTIEDADINFERVNLNKTRSYEVRYKIILNYQNKTHLWTCKSH